MFGVTHLSLRSMVVLALVLATAGLTAGSLWLGLRDAQAGAWADAQARAQGELAELVVVAGRVALSDPALLEELVALTATDVRLAHAVVINPDGQIVASTVSAELGRAAAAVGSIDPAWLARLRGSGQAQVLADPGLGRLVLAQAFAWPAAGGDLRGQRQASVLLRLDLNTTLAALRQTALRARLWDLAWLALAAALAYLLMEQVVVRPLRRLGAAARALGAGELAHRVPPTHAAELQAVGDAFNRMSTALASAMGRLADNERRYRELFDTAPDAMLTVTPEGNIDTFNQAAAEMFGHAAADAVGQPLARLLPPEARQRHPQHLAQFSAEGHGARRMAPNRLVTGLHQGGHRLTLEISISNTLQAAGPRFTAVVRDVSARLALEAELARHRDHLEAVVGERTAQLARSRDAAQAATRAKSEFLANMSHEIRTPMNAIIGLTHLMRRDANAAQLAWLTKLGGAAQHLLGILNDILDFSKIEAGKLQLAPRGFALDRLASDVCQLESDRAAGKGLALVQHIAPALALWRHGDDLRLRQVLINLLGNAVKFTEAGQVSLRLDAGPGHVVRFEVADTGIGIDEAERARIFQPFEQADTSATRRFGGTGLGLAISRALVEAMGGVLTSAPVPGGGSSFRFELPMPPGEACPAAGPPADGRPARAGSEAQLRALGGRRLLVVDDNALNQEVALHLLQDVGLHADLASDGLQALNRLRTGHYDLVLMDVQMPRLDGLGATRALRQLPGLATLPVLAMTAGALADDRAQCLAAGMNEVITKPVDPADLYAALLRWLPAPAAVAPATESALPPPASSPPPPPPPLPPPPLPSATIPAAPDLAPAAAPWPAVAGLDAAVGLRLVGGRPAVYQRVLLRFVEHHGGDAARLRAAAAAGNHAEIARLCHSLKGVAGTLGALALAAQADRAESLLLGRPGAAPAPAAAPESPDAAATATEPAADAVQALATQLDTMMAALPAAMATNPGAA